MLFNYKEFKNALRDCPDKAKREMIEKLESFSKTDDLTKEPFYNYIKKFIVSFNYKVPEDSKNDFDYKLLLALVAGSFSESYNINFPDELQSNDNPLLPELEIVVSYKGQTVIKKVSELWSFQIQRLFEIYLTEQIEFFLLLKEDKEDKKLFMREQNLNLKKFKQEISTAEAIIKRRKLLI